MYDRTVEEACRHNDLSKPQAIRLANLEQFLIAFLHAPLNPAWLWQYAPSTFDHVATAEDAERLRLIDVNPRRITKLGREVLSQLFPRYFPLQLRDKLGFYMLTFALEHTHTHLRLNKETEEVEIGYFPKRDMM